MSFPRIALFSLLVVPSLASIVPILSNIDANNPSGPHFRSFLSPGSLDSSLAISTRRSFSSFQGHQQIAPAVAAQEVPLVNGVVSDTKFTSSLRTLGSPKASPAQLSLASLKGHQQIEPAVAVQKDPLLVRHQVSDRHFTPKLPQKPQEHIESIVSENLQLSHNSLETFKVELHPEEELARSS
eukprot:TRINITY_DN14904_c0_g1_i5.p1 TRINITY_DN14904_c0_g1~~TRINITY_DN14904_c0_g1_i5.p1  ORF type:complete len:183 (-),score=22.68 TRINITY_DN14904_c0_g1_i5:60-608(-)